MRQRKILLTDGYDCGPWFKAVNGLIGIAQRQAEQGEMEAAKRTASEIRKTLDGIYEDKKRHWEICGHITPTFMLFAWRK